MIHIYTGDGKGKTTAALGQALRAVGYGKKIIMIQFLKGMESGELISVEKFGSNFEILRFDSSPKFFWNMDDKEKKELKEKIKDAFNFITSVIEDHKCDILIMDEIMGVLSNNLISKNNILNILNKKPEDMEIILTGRNVPEEILNIADLVTEMKMIKHPFQKGIPARKGIEY